MCIRDRFHTDIIDKIAGSEIITSIYNDVVGTDNFIRILFSQSCGIGIDLYILSLIHILGSITAIGIFNLRPRARKAISFVNNIPILNGAIIIGISLFLLFVSLGIPQGYTLSLIHI